MACVVFANGYCVRLAMRDSACESAIRSTAEHTADIVADIMDSYGWARIGDGKGCEHDVEIDGKVKTMTDEEAIVRMVACVLSM